MLYSNADVLAFVAVAFDICSLAIKGTQWRSQEFWMGTKPQSVKGMWERCPHPQESGSGKGAMPLSRKK